MANPLPRYGVPKAASTVSREMTSNDLEAFYGVERQQAPLTQTEQHRQEYIYPNAHGIESPNFFGREITSATMTLREEIGGPRVTPKTEFAGAGGGVPDGTQVLARVDEQIVLRTVVELAFEGTGALPDGWTLDLKGKEVNTELAAFAGVATATDPTFKVDLPAGVTYYCMAISEVKASEAFQTWAITINCNVVNSDFSQKMIGPGGNLGAPFVCTIIEPGDLTSAFYSVTERTVTLSQDGDATVSEAIDEPDDTASN